MPNGVDKVWYRFVDVLKGYRLRYAEWPKEVRLSRIAFDTFRSFFDAERWSSLTAKVLISRDGEERVRLFTATDGKDKRYDYWTDGCPDGQVDVAPEVWLGVSPTFPDEH